MKLVAIVGMAGSGKSIATDFFVSRGFEKVYFGGIVLEEVKKRGLELNEENEKKVREDLRQLHGMSAMAFLSAPRIKELLLKKKSVVIDGLYSWQEFVFLKKQFLELVLVAIVSSPATRYARLAARKERLLSEAECIARDKAEIENLQKAGPIAIADFTIINEGSKKEFEKELKVLFKKIAK